MRELELTSDESVEFVKLNAGVVQPSKTNINPYYLGLKILEDIEERYNNPTEEMKKCEYEEGKKVLFTYDGKSVHRKYV